MVILLFFKLFINPLVKNQFFIQKKFDTTLFFYLKPWKYKFITMSFEDLIRNNFDKILEIGYDEIKSTYQLVTIANAVNCFHSKNNQEDAIFPLAICYSLLKKNGLEFDKITKKGTSDLWISSLIERFNSL